MKGKQIGRGQFTKVYEHVSNPRQVIVVSSCLCKLAMSEGLFPEHSLFPSLDLIDQDNEGTYTFVTERLNPLKRIDQLDGNDQRIYRSLTNAWGNGGSFLEYRLASSKGVSDFNITRQVLEAIKDRELKELMIEGLYACSNYNSRVRFEAPKRNMMIHPKTGKLVLNDLFFHLN